MLTQPSSQGLIFNRSKTMTSSQACRIVASIVTPTYFNGRISVTL